MSPLLANLFLHDAFDQWMAEQHSAIPFERNADDVICRCVSEAQARVLREALGQRLRQWHLELHPHKTKIVYCKDANRRGSYPEQRFDFLGYTFRPRSSKNRMGQLVVSFAPAVSEKAAKAMRQRIRRWRLHHRNDLGLDDLARWTRPMVMGWARLLRAISRFGTPSRLAHAGCVLGAMGATEIQKTPRAQGASMEMVVADMCPTA